MVRNIYHRHISLFINVSYTSLMTQNKTKLLKIMSFVTMSQRIAEERRGSRIKQMKQKKIWFKLGLPAERQAILQQAADRRVGAGLSRPCISQHNTQKVGRQKMCLTIQLQMKRKRGLMEFWNISVDLLESRKRQRRKKT